MAAKRTESKKQPSKRQTSIRIRQSAKARPPKTEDQIWQAYGNEFYAPIGTNESKKQKNKSIDLGWVREIDPEIED